MSLRDELDTARKVIKTDSYPISIRELSSLYKDGESLTFILSFSDFCDGATTKRLNLSSLFFLVYHFHQYFFINEMTAFLMWSTAFNGFQQSFNLWGS